MLKYMILEIKIWHLNDEPKIELECQSVFWPRRASTTLEVKNDHAHVTTQRILHKTVEIKIPLGCMVWP